MKTKSTRVFQLNRMHCVRYQIGLLGWVGGLLNVWLWLLTKWGILKASLAVRPWTWDYCILWCVYLCPNFFSVVRWTYPWRDGQAEFAQVVWLHSKTLYVWMVTHFSTKILLVSTLLMQLAMFPLDQNANVINLNLLLY